MADRSVRLMHGEELQAVVDVWVRSRWGAQPWLEERMGYSDEQNKAYFRDVVAKECQVWLAVENDRVLGLLALADETIEHLYVDPDLQNRGIGAALLRKAMELRPDRLILFTHQRNENARSFYEKSGFVATRFGVSPAPENEPDVRYEWKPD